MNKIDLGPLSLEETKSLLEDLLDNLPEDDLIEVLLSSLSDETKIELIGRLSEEGRSEGEGRS